MAAQSKIQANVPSGLVELADEMAQDLGMNLGTLHSDLWKMGMFLLISKYDKLNAVKACLEDRRNKKSEGVRYEPSR